MNIKFYECNQENLEKVYSNYIEKIRNGEDCICTNVLCIVPYTKPKLNNSEVKQYIKTKYKLMTSTVLIKKVKPNNYYKYDILFAFGNISQKNIIKFAKMEDINWDGNIDEDKLHEESKKYSLLYNDGINDEFTIMKMNISIDSYESGYKDAIK